MKRILGILSVLLLMGTVPMTAQLDRTLQPPPGPAPSIKLPAVQRAALDNGLSLILVAHHELPVVQMQMVIKTGATADPIGKAGLSSITADLLDEGTASRTALELADEIDFIGADLNTSSSFDGSFVNLLVLTEHLEKGAELFADVVLHPALLESEFDRLKKELQTDLLQRKDRPDAVATTVFYSRMYGPAHPYGYEVNGNEETAAVLTLDDVKKFYQSYYVPNNATLVAVGDIAMDQFKKIASRMFSGWKGSDIPKVTVPQATQGSGAVITIVNKAEAPQSQIRLGNIGVQRDTEDYFAVSVLNQILGAPNGRLYLNLREAKGYTYGAYSQFIMRQSAGPFLAYAGVRTDVTDSSVIEFMKEINRLRDELVPEEEFNMYKSAVIQRLPSIFETPAQISGQLSSVVVYNLADNYFDGLVENYRKVTREDVQRVARKYMQPENISIVIVGDEAKIKDKLAALRIGTVIVCDEKGNKIE